MKIGVIGAGRIGKVHIRNISLFVTELEIKTVADPFANEQTEAYAAQFGIKNVTKNADDIFNDPEIEAVAICSSTDTHSKYIIAAAQAVAGAMAEKEEGESTEKREQQRSGESHHVVLMESKRHTQAARHEERLNEKQRTQNL